MGFVHEKFWMVHSQEWRVKSYSLQCTGKTYLLKAQHSAFNIVDSKTIPLTVQNWQITSFVPDSTDLVLDSSNICFTNCRHAAVSRIPQKRKFSEMNQSDCRNRKFPGFHDFMLDAIRGISCLN